MAGVQGPVSYMIQDDVFPPPGLLRRRGRAGLLVSQIRVPGAWAGLQECGTRRLCPHFLTALASAGQGLNRALQALTRVAILVQPPAV